MDVKVTFDDINVQEETKQTDVKVKFNEINVQKETEQTLVKVLMLKGDKGDSGETSDLTNYYDKTETDNLLSGKVDKVAGKQLSTEDFTTAEKTKLANIDVSGIPNYSTGTWTPVFAYYFKTSLTPTLNRWKIMENVNYSKQEGVYVLIGDLCYVNFSIKGYITQSAYEMGVGGFPFYASSNTSWQTLSLGACARYSSDDGSQLWTPPAAAVSRIQSGEKFAMIGRSNGYVETIWPDEKDNPYYIEGSGVYKIKNSNLSEVLIDTTGSSASLTTPEGES